MIESTQADIVIGTESWLDDSIKSSEIFPSNFRSYRRDCSTGARGGGVFLLVSDKFQSNEPEELRSSVEQNKDQRSPGPVWRCLL